jgi:hypothetical protein
MKLIEARAGADSHDLEHFNKQEAYEAMKKDNEIGIWTLDFAFTNVAGLMA